MKTLFLVLSLLCVTLGRTVADDVPEVNYTFQAKVAQVLDGKTVALDVDLGFGVWLHKQPFRLQGVPAPDADTADKEEALKWKTKAQEVLSVGLEVVLQSIKDKTDKTTTYHAVLWKDGENLNAKIAGTAKSK